MEARLAPRLTGSGDTRAPMATSRRVRPPLPGGRNKAHLTALGMQVWQVWQDVWMSLLHKTSVLWTVPQHGPRGSALSAAPDGTRS